jgi:uncharacterized protein
MNCIIEAKTAVNPTEDMDKVIKAFSNVFNYDDLIISEDTVTVTGNMSCLLPFKEFLEKRQIRDTARKMLQKGLDEDSNIIQFKINKQAAFAGRINLVDDDLSPLGEIDIIIKTDNPAEFIGWLCDH